MSYIVFIKILIPRLLILQFYGSLSDESDPLPALIGRGPMTGQIFWAALYSFAILLPLSLPRHISKITLFSIIGFVGSIYIAIMVIVIFFVDKELVPSPMQ